MMPLGFRRRSVGLDALHECPESTTGLTSGFPVEGVAVPHGLRERASAIPGQVQRFHSQMRRLFGERIAGDPALGGGAGRPPLPLGHGFARHGGQCGVIIVKNRGPDSRNPLIELRSVAHGESGHESGDHRIQRLGRFLGQGQPKLDYITMRSLAELGVKPVGTDHIPERCADGAERLAQGGARFGLGRFSPQQPG